MAPSNNDDNTSLKSKMESSLKRNPSALGDPVSLKAETSDSRPTDDDKPLDDDQRQQLQGDASKGGGERVKGSGDEGGGKNKKSLKEAAMSNPTMLGDPVSLKAETSDTEPTRDDRGAGGTEKRKRKDSKL